MAAVFFMIIRVFESALCELISLVLIMLFIPIKLEAKSDDDVPRHIRSATIPPVRLYIFLNLPTCHVERLLHFFFCVLLLLQLCM